MKNIVFNFPESFGEKNKISIFSKLSDKESAEELKQHIKVLWWEISMIEKIWPITEPETPTNVILISQNIEVDTSSTQDENNIETGAIDTGIEEEKPNISNEYSNQNTKIIINRIDQQNPSVLMLKRLLQLTDEDIEIQSWESPKYARDPDTKIEIIFTS